jgi:type I restriction enzyme S subunit
MNNNKYIPLLRFPEFQNDGEWELRSLAEILNYEQPGAYIVNDTNYKKTGTPVLTANKGFILGYTDESYGVYNDLPVIIFDDFTTDKKFVNFPFKVKSSAIKLLTLKNKNRDDLKFIFECMKNIKFEEKEHKRYYISTYQNIKILVPKSTQEQKKIADCFVSIDKEIDATKRKLEQLKEHKKGLMQKLFPAKGKTLPELRFPEFQNAGEWQIVPLGEITSVVNRRNKSNRSLPIYSINNAEGFVPQSQQFAGMDSEARGYDISVYKIIGKHTFAYNPARINVGSIGYSGELKDILISSLYVCLKTMDNVDDDFIMCFFNSYIFNQAVESNVEGGIRSYLFYENFSRINIAIPTLYEQKRIASCITSIEDMIKKTNEQIILFETHKKGLLQQLFPMIK